MNIETLFFVLMDHDQPPWAAVAFDRVAGIVIWYPAIHAWVQNSEFLAPYIVGYERGGYAVDRVVVEDLIAAAVGPRGVPARWLTIPPPEDVAHLPS